MRTATLALVADGRRICAVAAPAAGQPSVDVTFGRALNALTATDGVTTTVRLAADDGGRSRPEHRVANEQHPPVLLARRRRLQHARGLELLLHTAGGTWRSTKPVRRARRSSSAVRPPGGRTARRGRRPTTVVSGAFANVEWRPRRARPYARGTVSTSGAFRTSPELNQREHEGFGSVLVNLQSRTTLIAEVRAGVKSVRDRHGVFAVPVDATSSAPSVPGSNGRGPGLARGPPAT